MFAIRLKSDLPLLCRPVAVATDWIGLSNYLMTITEFCHNDAQKMVVAFTFVCLDSNI